MAITHQSPPMPMRASPSIMRCRRRRQGATEAGGRRQSFGAMLKDALGNVSEAGHKSDAQSMAMASGKANIVDVVTAVAETEVAVSTLVSVRDKVIQAYEDIMKMPI